MAPNQSRQLLLLSIPTIAVLLSYLWYKRKRTGVGSDPGEISEQPLVEERSIKEESSPIKIPVKKDNSPEKKFSRSLSAPIDIVLPKEHRSRTAPIISDEDLDVEIKRMKSMKSTLEPYKIQSISAMDTPKKSSNKEKPISDLQKTANQTNPPQTKKQNSIKKTKSDSNKAKPAKSSEKKTKISQKEIAVVEAQLTNLQLTAEKPDSPIKTKSKVKNSDSHSSSEPEEQQGQTSPNERDSANHSPVDVIMASPTLSNFSDNHSEVMHPNRCLGFITDVAKTLLILLIYRDLMIAVREAAKLPRRLLVPLPAMAQLVVISHLLLLYMNSIYLKHSLVN